MSDREGVAPPDQPPPGQGTREGVAPPDDRLGVKRLDYWWTVLAVDPVALPVTRFLTRRRWLSPDQVTLLSLAAGLAAGASFATASRVGLIVGGVLYYVSFMLDCVDGKLARALGGGSPRGARLEKIADGARRLSAALGLTAYLYRNHAGAELWWAIAFGLAASYFMEMSGDPAVPEAPRGRIGRALARRRLLARPGMPDVSALVYVVGPIAGIVVPALIAGVCLVSLAILRTLWRALRE